MSVEYKEVETINEFIDAIRIRVDVFIKEQKCEPGWEPDEGDKNSKQFIALVDKKIVSTLRMRQTGDKEFKIERMATIREFRKKGITIGLVEFVVGSIKNLGPGIIWMQSQVQAQKFYEKCGFAASSKPYNLYGIQHVDMEYRR